MQKYCRSADRFHSISSNGRAKIYTQLIVSLATLVTYVSPLKIGGSSLCCCCCCCCDCYSFCYCSLLWYFLVFVRLFSCCVVLFGLSHLFTTAYDIIIEMLLSEILIFLCFNTGGVSAVIVNYSPPYCC